MKVHHAAVAKNAHEAISRVCAETGLNIGCAYIVTSVEARPTMPVKYYTVETSLESLPTCERDELLIAADILEERGMDQAAAVLRKIENSLIEV